MTSPIVVVGATGFVGRAVCKQLAREGQAFRALGRAPHAPPFVATDNYLQIPSLPADPVALAPALRDASAVIHLASLVHVMDGDGPERLPEFRRQNVEGARCLAKAALLAGVRRYVYASTIKVHGEATPDTVWQATDLPRPTGSYAQSKLEAEQTLQAQLSKGGCALSIVRPTLVYGPHVGANFLRLLKWVWRGVPLPFGAIHNRRSLVGVRNLSDLLIRACQENSSHVLLVSDGPTISTTDLLRGVGAALGRPARLLPVPAWGIRAAARLAGRSAIADRLLGSLTVDSRPTEDTLSWKPPWTWQQELEHTANWFTSER